METDANTIAAARAKPKIRIIFWSHLIVGLVMGIFVGLMSITGVLLTYERQIKSWAENAAIEAPADAEPLTVQQLADAAISRGAEPGHTLTIPLRDTGAVAVAAGRRDRTLLNPYDAEPMPGAGENTSAFFSRVTRIHRWLAFWGGRNEAGAQINGAANLGFAFLILTGIYLWLPKLWNWGQLRIRLIFQKSNATARARHFNWHHVAGIWMAIPLLAIVLSGTMFSYSWVNTIIYAAYGQSPPERGGGGPPERGGEPSPPPVQQAAVATLPLDDLLAQANEAVPRGRRATITLPEPADETIRISIDRGNGAQASKVHELELWRGGNGVIAPEAAPPANGPQQTRRFLRFLHTGEIYGFWGQTIAGLASLFAVLLVYSGFCLAVTRLARMYRKRPGGQQ